ncbi:MAG TPA: hypothetical protein VM364_00480 [Vicinamibacterales bacterium]|nr:hypothetical protein [Vicinamibacterales bacterium]
MTELLFVQGTSGLPDDPDPARPRNWWRDGSPLTRWLRPRGFVPLCPEDPYHWTTDLNGWRFWRRWVGKLDSRRDWLVGGRALRWWLVAKGVDARRRRIWCHSHGLQVVLHAAAEWHEEIFCEVLVSFGSPLRADVPWQQALPKIRHWLIVTDERDLVQALGRLGDGAIGSYEDLPEHVEVLQIPHIEHSKLLQDEKYFELLEAFGILRFTAAAYRSVRRPSLSERG